MKDYVLLSNTSGDVKGIMSKEDAHNLGELHKAFSVFIFNDKKEFLLQRRALDKYHSPGLWTNTCCSHQRINESSIEAGNRRLKEEMNLTSQLREVFTVLYRAEFSNGMVENEYDHILLGHSNVSHTNFNKEEVMDIRWASIDYIRKDIKTNPNMYTYWFKLIINKYYDKMSRYI